MENRLIYICSPYAGNTEENITFVRQACCYAIRQGAIPLAPHLLYPQILDDNISVEREIGIRLGMEVLRRCEEVWICGDQMSEGMKWEAEYAKAREIPVRRVPACEIAENRMLQEKELEPIRGCLEIGQPDQKDVQMEM